MDGRPAYSLCPSFCCIVSSQQCMGTPSMWGILTLYHMCCIYFLPICHLPFDFVLASLKGFKQGSNQIVFTFLEAHFLRSWRANWKEQDEAAGHLLGVCRQMWGTEFNSGKGKAKTDLRPWGNEPWMMLGLIGWGCKGKWGWLSGFWSRRVGVFGWHFLRGQQGMRESRGM